MEKIFRPFFDFFKFHWKKMVFAIIVFLISFVFLFPFNDLGGWVTTWVATQSRNQVFLQFEELGISLIPQPGLSVSKVNVETRFLPALNVGEISASISLPALLSFKPGYALHMEDIFGGSVDVSAKMEGKSQSGGDQYAVDLETNGLALKELTKFGDLPIRLNGGLDMDLEGKFESSFAEQPEGEVSLKISKFVLPAGNISTQMGPMPIPKIALGTITLEGELRRGTLVIKTATLGGADDELKGKITGQLDLKIQKAGPSVAPQLGAYDLVINLDATQQFITRVNLFFLLDKFKRPIPGGGATYSFRVSGANFQAPPKFSAAN